jgi:hypothetical protein
MVDNPKMSSTLIPTIKTLHRTNVNDYRSQMRQFVMTSRFSNSTMEENIEYRNAQPNVGCIYCSPSPVTLHIPHESIMFVLEMNNDQNEIMGIGMVMNKPRINRYSVYKNGNYNRYSFVGTHRIDRTQMNEEEKVIMRVFDILCFTGNRHMKRGQGVSMFPVDMLYKCHKKVDLIEFIRNMFKIRFSK